MDFTFSPGQEALREAVRSFLTRSRAGDHVRRMIDDSRGFTDRWWREIVDLGWPGLLIPEEAGGAGLGLLDAVVLQEEVGRFSLTGPVFSSAIAASLAAIHLDAVELQHDMAGGRRRGTVAIQEAGSADPLESVAATAVPVAGSEGAFWELDGVKELVLDGHTADFAVVAARTSDGLAAFVLDEPSGVPVPTLDVTRKATRVDLAGRTARRIGPPGDQREVLGRLCDDLAVALCAETVGAADRALEMAIDYAKERVQFDRPIAAFQAIRHKIVDMLHQLELARVGTHWAAWASQVDDPVRPAAVAACKSFVSEAAVMITGESIQVHGGVGFTWDTDCHLLFRRVKQNDIMYGNQACYRHRLADLVLGAPVPAGGGHA